MTSTRSTASSWAADRQAGRSDRDSLTMGPHFDPLRLHRAALRAGDRPLADLIARAIGRDPRMRRRVLRDVPHLGRVAGAPASGPAQRTMDALVLLLGLGGRRG